MAEPSLAWRCPFLPQSAGRDSKATHYFVFKVPARNAERPADATEPPESTQSVEWKTMTGRHRALMGIERGTLNDHRRPDAGKPSGSSGRGMRENKTPASARGLARPRLLLSLRNLLGAGGVFLLLACGIRLCPFLRSLFARGFQ